MAYETGTATGPADLIAKLETFAIAQGWTVSAQTTSAASGTTPLSKTGKVFSKGDLVFGLGYDTTDVYLCGATAVNGGANWNVQTGTSITTTSATTLCRINDMTGPYQSYHFFAGTSPDHIHVAVEVTAGLYRHFCFGSLIKHGAYTGGAYFGGVWWRTAIVTSFYQSAVPDSGYHAVLFDAESSSTASSSAGGAVRADIDAKTNNWMFFNDASAHNGNRAKGVIRTNGILESLHERSPSEFNQLTPLLPMPIAVERAASQTSMAGYVPNMRYVNVTNFTPGEVVTIGPDEWVVFPLTRKTEVWGSNTYTYTSSGTYGLAYKRN